MNVYELYQGEEYLGKGTVIELSKEFNIPKKSIYNFASKEFHERQDEVSKAKIAFKVGGKMKPVIYKTALDEKIDKIVELYFQGYDLKTLLKRG